MNRFFILLIFSRDVKVQDWFSTINYLMIEANSQCNLKCQTCTREILAEEGLRKPLLITPEKLIFLLEQLKDCPITTIKFEGLSEPFLHPYFFDLCGIVKRYFSSAHLIVITNLQYAIGNVNFKKVCEHAGAIYISIDGTEELYENIRTGAKWSVALKNLNYINDNLSHELKEKIYINFTASKKNYLQLPQIYNLKEQFKLGGVRINLVQNWEEGKLNDNDFPKEMLSFLKNYIIDLKGASPWDFQDCFWPFNGIVIDVEGNVRQCVLNTTQKPIGNAFVTPLKKIYNEHPYFLQLRNSLFQNFAPVACVNCDYKNLNAVLSELFQSEIRTPKTKVLL